VALAEMRTLLLELRPSALEEAELADLLLQLAEPITSRARVPVTLEVEGECSLEAGIRIALYPIAPTLFQDQVPLLENVTSMSIQAMDVGLIVPLCLLSGILLLRRNAWGYLLASVGMMGFLTVGIAVSLMGLNMARVGVPVSAVELGVFPIIAQVNLVMVGLLLKNIKD
jgi:hypothetical protein